MGNITINAKGEKVNRDGLTFEEFAKKELAKKAAQKASPGTVTKNAKGETVNRDGLTFEEFATLKIYERDKKAGKMTQSYNAAQISSGLSRDKFDSKVRGGSSKDKTLPKNPEKATVTVFNPDRSSLSPTVTKETELPEKKGYYSMPKILTDTSATDAAEEKIRFTDKVYGVYGKLISNSSTKIKEQDARLGELEKELSALGADYEASPSATKAAAYNAKYDELVALEEERNSLAEKYNSYITETKDLGQLYSSYVNEYTAQNKDRIEAYKDWRFNVRGSEAVKSDIEATDKAIKELQKELTVEFNPIEYYKKIGNREWRETTEKELEAIRAKKALLEEELGAAEAIEWAEYYASYAEKDDFAEKSKYKSTANGKEAELNPHTGYFTDLGYDAVYEYVNDTEGVRDTVDELTVEQLSYLTGLYEIAQLTALSDEERKLYNYLYATEGSEEALNFLEGLIPDLNMRYTKNLNAEYAEYSDKHHWKASFLRLGLGLLKPTVYLGQVIDYIDDGKIDQYALYNQPVQLSTTIVETVSSNFGAIGSFWYNIGMSMADNLLSLAVTGGMSKGLMLAILGSSAAADSTIAAKERGLSDDQAILLGTITGAVEIATEKIPLERLFDIIGKGGKVAVKDLLKQAFTEAGEEMSSEVLNTIADVLVAGDKSEWRKKIDEYIANGHAEGVAFLLALRDKGIDVLVSGAGGFISGGLMPVIVSTPKTISHTIKRIDYKKTVGKALKGNIDAQEALIADALKFSKDSEGYKLAEKIDAELRAGKTPKTSDLVKLEGYWELVDDTPKIVAELAKEDKTIDEVKKHLRDLGISDKVVTDTMIEEAYNKNPGASTANSKAFVTMEDFANSNSSVWKNVDYNDNASKTSIMRSAHDSMVSEGRVVRVSADVMQNVEQSYPDLRDMKKKERTSLLKEAMGKLKTNLRQFLGNFKNQNFEFEVNGKVLEAKLYNTGINEVLEKITKEKANMLYSTGEIFANAQYLYSTQDYDGDPNIYRWNYFYTPVQIGEDVVGVRIAVRDTATPKESQIYNWNIKKDTSLDGVGRGANRISHGVSSDVSNNSIPQKGGNVNPDVQNSSADDLDAPYESEITEHKKEIEETNRVYKHDDPAMQRYIADWYLFEKDLKEKGKYEGHPITKAPTDTERSGIIYGASQADIDTALRLSKALGRKIMFFSEQSRNGRIKNGTLDRDIIWINVQRQAGKTVEWVIAHELTHSIEDTRAYERLKDYVWKKLGNEKVEAQREELKQNYDSKEIDFEIVCNYVADNLLTSEKAITDLVRHNRTLGEKVRSIINKIGAKLKNAKAKEALDIDNMLNIYKRAFAEQSGIEQNTDGYESEFDRKKAADPDDILNDRYIKSLREQFSNGEISKDELDALVEEYVDRLEEGGGSATSTDKARYSFSNDSENDVIDLSDDNELSKRIQGDTGSPKYNKIKQYILEVLSEQPIQLSDGKIAIVDKSDAQHIARGAANKKTAQIAKIREIIETAQLYAEDNHVKHDKFNYFCYYKAHVRYKGEIFSIYLNVGKGKTDSKYHIYDITNKIRDTAGRINGLGRPKPNEGIRHANGISGNSITDPAQKVNTSDENIFPFSDDAQNSYSSMKDLSDKVGKEYAEVTKDMNPKGREYLASAERAFTRRLAEIFSLPTEAKRGLAKDIAKSIILEQIKNGAVTTEFANDIFEKAFDAGVIVDDSYLNENKDLKNYLRKTAVTLSERDKADLGDWKAFRKSAFGKLNIKNKGGLPVDSAYEELKELYPGHFPEEITHPADQLDRMLKVAESITVQETSLYEAYGENPDVYEWLRNDFNELIGEFTKNIDYGKNYVEEVARRMAEEELVIPSAESLFETYKQIKSLRAIAAKAVAKNVLLPIEESLVKDLLTGRITLEQIPAETYNVQAIKEVYEAKLPYEYAMRVINAYHNHRKSTQYERADALLEGFASWKKHTSGLSLSINTMERNFRALCEGDPQRAEELIKEYISPVHSHEALSTRYKNKFLDEIRKLEISQKKAKGNRDSEAAAVQFMGEAKSHIERLEAKPRLGRSGGLTLEEWQEALSDFETANPNLDYKKIDNCIRTFRKIYNQLFDDMNKARMLNGYEPIDYRYAYFPHFQKDKVSWARELFLPQKQVDNLPATIAGLTENFKPGIRWLSQAQRRSMSDTEYDCLEGFDRYINGAADVIFHTEDIQKLRSLANRIRYQASDEAIKKRIEAIEADDTLTDEEKHERIAEEAASKFTLASFVNEVDEYTNILAGKKSRADRQMEQDLGREFYNYSTWLKRRFGANMIAGNLGSAFTNLIPLVQAAGITKGTLLKAMYAEIKSIANDDGFSDRSDFLTNRYGSDRLSGKAIEKISDAFGLPMEFIDHFSSGAIVRALYEQARRSGLSEAEAMEQADARAADIMADRSKGSMPTIFARSNFTTAILTQFQLEVANQYSYLFKDLPRYFGGSDKKAKKLVGAIFKIFILSYLFNDVYEAIVGRRSALDPFDIINDAVGDMTGYKLPNMFDAIDDAIHGEFGADTFKTQREGVVKGIWNLATESAAELPFVGSFATSLFGADGGRIPIGSALPDVQALVNTFSSDSTNAKKIQKLITELTKPASNLLLPFGGAQIKKMAQGVTAWAKGGEWTEDNKGRDQLKYPIKNVGEGIQSVIFGKYASRSGREWIENGFDTMSANQTADYKTFLSAGYSKEKSFDKARELYECEHPHYFAKFVKNGVGVEGSLELTKKISELEVANGKDENLTRTQKAEIIVSTVQDKGERLSALKAVLTEKEYAKFELAQNSFGVPAVHYVTAKTKIEKLKEEGGYKSTSQEVVKIVLDEMDLYDGQKAALWQLIGGWKPESNPYNVKRGKEVYEALEKMNE